MTYSLSRRQIGAMLAGVLVLALAVLLVRPYEIESAQLKTSVERSQRAAQAMLRLYDPTDAGFMGRYPAAAGRIRGASWAVQAQSFQPAELWGYSWALAAIEDMAQAPDGARYLPEVRRLADHLSLYWNPGAPAQGYAPTIDPSPNAMEFYDDNAWVGLDLIGAYRLTHDRRYLAQAQAVFRFEETGWDARAGGIFWDEARLTRNAASSGPAAELAAYLYLETHNRAYLEWAQRIYLWEVRYLVDPQTGQVFDNIDGSGDVDQSMWTYNQGSLIGTAALLYRATGQRQYLRQAHKTEAFVMHDATQPSGAFAPQSEFNGVLADNLALLYEVSPDEAIPRAIARNARLIWAKARNAQDLFADNWDGPPPATFRDPLLFQTGAVRLLAVNAAITTGGFADLGL